MCLCVSVCVCGWWSVMKYGHTQEFAEMFLYSSYPQKYHKVKERQFKRICETKKNQEKKNFCLTDGWKVWEMKDTNITNTLVLFHDTIKPTEALTGKQKSPQAQAHCAPNVKRHKSDTNSQNTHWPRAEREEERRGGGGGGGRKIFYPWRPGHSMCGRK